MTGKIIECVPNFSEGRNRDVIAEIARAIESVEEVKLLNVDSGEGANRTVMTFAGSPEAVVEAAYNSIISASRLIDMSLHHGEHPRIGATDVCPLVPVKGVTMEECVAYARELARRVGESGIAVYCYENAAFVEERRNLATCRKGEYEGIEKRMADIRWRPDFGPVTYNEQVRKSGISVIGAREFLVAINFNLNSNSVETASEIAKDVREKGRKIVENGVERWQRGTLKGCKAIGWYIKEYKRAQVSMNITDLEATPLHMAYEEVSRRARLRGVEVTGSELIGLLPKRALLRAGEYFFSKRGGMVSRDEAALLQLAADSMGFADLAPFDYKKRIIEELLFL